MDHSTWLVACGGTELPFDFQGQTFLYMWNTTTGQHAYYCRNRDIFVVDFRSMELA